MIRLKELREEKGLNMRQASFAIGLPYTTYVSWEKGEREPNSESLIMLANFFDCSIDYLLGRSDKRFVSSSDEIAPTISEPKPALSDDDIKFALWHGADGITDEMYEEVKQYAEMVQLREERKKKD